MQRFAVIAAVVITLLIAWGYGWTTGSSTTAGFGISAGHSAERDAYFVKVKDALTGWLTQQGFQPAAVDPERPDYPPLQSSWFRGTYQDSRPFTVQVRLDSGNGSGISTDLFWEFQGLRWKEEQDRARANSFVPVLARWWKEYRKSHPFDM